MYRCSSWRQAGWLCALPALLAAQVQGAEQVDLDALPDPTRPIEVAPGPVREEEGERRGLADILSMLSNYEVSSILIRSGLKVAVVNSQRVREGDAVGDARVVRIEPGRVMLAINGQVREIRLHQGSVKTPVSSGSER